MSPPEIALWAILRERPQGFKFRRQRPKDPFIFDFFCRAALLAIEIDGFAHDCGDNPRRDAARDEWAAKKGIKTIRIAASDIRTNIEGAVIFIVQQCTQRTPPPRSARSPSPATAGEDKILP